AVNLVRAGAGGDGNIRARVAALFGSGVGRGDLELLHVVRVQAEDVVSRVGIRALVGFDAVDGDVDRGSPRAVDLHRVARTLHYAGFVHQQIERVAPVQRQVDDGLLLDHVA